MKGQVRIKVKYIELKFHKVMGRKKMELRPQKARSPQTSVTKWRTSFILGAYQANPKVNVVTLLKKNLTSSKE